MVFLVGLISSLCAMLSILIFLLLSPRMCIGLAVLLVLAKEVWHSPSSLPKTSLSLNKCKLIAKNMAMLSIRTNFEFKPSTHFAIVYVMYSKLSPNLLSNKLALTNSSLKFSTRKHSALILKQIQPILNSLNMIVLCNRLVPNLISKLCQTTCSLLSTNLSKPNRFNNMRKLTKKSLKSKIHVQSVLSILSKHFNYVLHKKENVIVLEVVRTKWKILFKVFVVMMMVYQYLLQSVLNDKIK
mmetsp:Transcript_5516/g.8426  ORF Transcript_5516/g.8426 Transcript_5516/m.8426 type:complete len:241 (-) Transcript_5516:28-750(-)